MSTATRALKMDKGLSELRKIASEFGIAELVDAIEEEADDFVQAGEEWVKDTKEDWQRVAPGERAWTPIATGNLASSVDDDIEVPRFRVGVNYMKITDPVDDSKHSDAGRDYTEYPNVGTRTGAGPDFIDLVWFETAKINGKRHFPKGLKAWEEGER